MDFKINQQERDALKGLPHLARLAYFEAIRPYMDFDTGIVGIKRGISYQSLGEELYVESHVGYVSGSPSKQQLRRALKTLERASLISIQSVGKKLILKCELASADYSGQNKVDTKPTHQVDTKSTHKNSYQTINYDLNTEKADSSKSAQADTPPVSDNNYVFVCEAFQKFWKLYPMKLSKQKAWEAWNALTPSENLFQQIISSLKAQCAYREQAAKQSEWVPNWKNASNWLMQACWEDELPVKTFIFEEKGESHAIDQRHFNGQPKRGNALFEYCKDAIENNEEFSANTSTGNNILSIEQYKQ